MAIAFSKMQSRFLKSLIASIAAFTAISGATQNITNEIKNSILQYGNNNTSIQSTQNINKTYITNNYTDLNLKNTTDELLAKNLKFISDANAEKAEKNGHYVLASEIYEQLYESLKKIKHNEDDIVNLLLKIATLQEKFNQQKATNTYKTILKFQPRNIICLERIATLNLDNLLFDESILMLNTIVNSVLTSPRDKDSNSILYLTHFKIATIYNVLGLNEKSTEAAINASTIYDENFTAAEKENHKLNQIILIDNYIKTTFENNQLNSNYFTKFESSIKSIHDDKIDYFGPHEKFYYLDVRNKLIFKADDAFSKKTKILSQVAVNETTYFVGMFETNVIKLVKKFIAELSKLDNDSPEVRRLHQRTYDELVLLANTCSDCPSTYRAKGLAHFFMSNIKDGSIISSEQYFHLKEALRNFQLINDFYINNPKNHELLTTIYERIGDARIIDDPGLLSITSNINPLSAYHLAIKSIDKILQDEPNSAKFKIFKLRILQKIGKYYIDNFHYEESLEACKEASMLYKSAYTNVIFRDAGFNDYFLCQFHKIQISARREKSDQITVELNHPLIVEGKELLAFSDEQNIKHSEYWLPFMTALRTIFENSKTSVPSK